MNIIFSTKLAQTIAFKVDSWILNRCWNFLIESFANELFKRSFKRFQFKSFRNDLSWIAFHVTRIMENFFLWGNRSRTCAFKVHSIILNGLRRILSFIVTLRVIVTENEHVLLKSFANESIAIERFLFEIVRIRIVREQFS